MSISQPDSDLQRSANVDQATEQMSRTGLAAVGTPSGVSASQFAELAAAITGSSKRILYEEDRISPRSLIEGAVYTSTDFSSLASIYFHNECAGKNEWPQYICFSCVKAANEGGSTTVTESFKILDQLNEKTRRAFEERKVLYRRIVGGNKGNTLIQNFGTEDKDLIEDLCMKQDIETEWLGETKLRLTYQRDAIYAHPKTGEPLWFNNVFFWSPLALDKPLRRAILKTPEEERPFMSYFGDGSAIPEEMLVEIGALYQKNEVKFSWHEGDILAMDNMRYAHGRERFSGERLVWTVMLEPCSKNSNGGVSRAT